MRILLLLFIISPFIALSQDSSNNEDSTFNFKENLRLPLDLNMNFIYEDYNKYFGEYQKDYRFTVSNLVFQIMSKLSPQIDFNYRMVFNNPTLEVDNLSGNIQFLNLGYKTKNNKWYFNFGKQFLQVGSIEQSYDPNDVYLYSLISNSLPIFRMGAYTSYSINDKNSIGFQVANNYTDSINKQTDLLLNTFYFGSLFNGNILPRMSFSFGLEDKTNNLQYVGYFGSKFKFKKFELDVDYAIEKEMKSFFQNALYQSAPIRLIYNGKKFKPIFKYIFNSVIADEAIPVNIDNNIEELKKLNTHSFELAIQYYPIPNKNLRFHLVGIYTNDQKFEQLVPDSNNLISRSHLLSQYQIMLGIRLGLDFMIGLREI